METVSNKASVNEKKIISCDGISCRAERDPIDRDVQKLLHFLGQQTGCERAYIFEMEDSDTYSITYEWCAAGITPQKAALQREDRNTIDWWFSAFERDEPIVILDREDIKEVHPLSYTLFKLSNAYALFAVPLTVQKKLVGFIGVDNPAPKTPDTILPLLRFVSRLVVRDLQTRSLLKEFQQMSFCDQLTGALNRYALQRDLAYAMTWDSVGILYCDISSLKKINDTESHAAGDKIIRDCNDILAYSFPECPTYRTGGDEFLVLCPDISQEQFLSKVAIYIEQQEKCQTHIAWGIQWTDSFTDIHQQIAAAEKKMYKNKAAYYTQRQGPGKPPQDRRRNTAAAIPYEIGRNKMLAEFLQENYFDIRLFLDAIGRNDLFVYFGDMQRSCFYVSDAMRDVVGFPSNIIVDLLTIWETAIATPEDLKLYRQDLSEIQAHRREFHDLRYRIRDKAGNEFWINCYGKLLWDKQRDQLLFFAGTVTKIEFEFIVDPITDFLREHGALVKLKEIQQVKRRIRCIGFCLHHFHDINQLHGRQVANDLLKSIANALTKQWSESLIFFRLDGMRFLALMSPDAPEDPQNVIRALRSIIEALYAEYELPVQKSCSFAFMPEPSAAAQPHDILAEMNNLLNMAKDDPLQEFVTHSSQNLEMRLTRSRMMLEANCNVKRRFENFRIVIQPVVSNAPGFPVTSGECLLRWNFEGKPVSPAVFIPILESSDQINPVGKWVFERAVLNCKRLLEHRPDFRLNFNVSYPQILDSGFLPFIKKTLEKWNLPGEHLVMEMTETHYNENPKRLTEFIQGCRELGMLVALDDFGTGYSSLELLMKYPSDIIKLDRSLMKVMADSSKSNDFITSIVYACHKFGKRVCVEGVETEEELNMVLEAGCDMVQGFYFHRPLEVPDFYALIAAKNLESRP